MGKPPKKVHVIVTVPLPPVINPPSGDWPGQLGNPVGHTAAPGWPGSFTGNALYSAPSNPCTYPQFCTGLGGSGIVNGTTYSFVDINNTDRSVSTYTTRGGGLAGSAITNVTFLGFRFQGNWKGGPLVNTAVNNSIITFKYCTFCPRLDQGFQTNPRGNGVWLQNTWPSDAAGLGIPTGFPGEAFTRQDYMINQDFSSGDCAINLNTGGGTITFDHCDIWGSQGQAGSIRINSASVTNVVVRDCWIHALACDAPYRWDTNMTYNTNSGIGPDSARNAGVAGVAHFFTTLIDNNLGPPGGTGHDPPTGGDSDWHDFGDGPHGSGIAYAQTGNCPQNITIDHCTIASLGNTQGIGFQGGPNHAYQNIQVTRNYISWSNIWMNPCAGQNASTGLVFTDNVFATDMGATPAITTTTVLADQTLFTQSITGNIWRRNIVRKGSGVTPVGCSDGDYIFPTGAFSTGSDWSF